MTLTPKMAKTAFCTMMTATQADTVCEGFYTRKLFVQERFLKVPSTVFRFVYQHVSLLIKSSL